jgi:hypothetical protein
MRVKIDTKDFTKKINNAVQYGSGYINETKKSESKVARKIGQTSIEAFYDFLDSMATMHPDMLHHVYEWGQTGNQGGKLYELRVSPSGGRTVIINSRFLPSSSISDQYSTPFVNKAEVMELGLPVVIEQVNAQALFFTQGGQEFFRMGPIVIENPGGPGVRGSFLKFFEMFYNEYLMDVYLDSIGFYRHMSQTRDFERGWVAGVSGGGYNSGVAAAKRWITSAPGDDYGNL